MDVFLRLHGVVEDVHVVYQLVLDVPIPIVSVQPLYSQKALKTPVP